MEKEALFKLGYGLYVLTANSDGKDNGCITNAVMQVTDTPAMMTLAVNKESLTCEEMVKDGRFNLSVLDESASFDIFKRFGFASGRDTDKFDGFPDVERSKNGLLYITKSTNAFISGEVNKTVDLKTHILFIADITDAKILSDRETATYSFYHSNIKPKPKKTGKKGWRCTVCGYIYEGEELPEDFICPICKHGADVFEKIE